MQLELIPRPEAPTRAQARRAALLAAKARAEQGMDRAARKASRLNAGWCSEALERVRRFAAGQAGLWTIEMVRAVIEEDLEQPSDGRAWGRVTQDALRLGFIVKTDKTAPSASSNGAPKPLFKRGPKA